MRRKKTMPISEILKEYKKEMNIENKLKEVQIIQTWGEIVGKAIAKHTSRVYIKESVLYIHLDSPVVRNELLMIKGVIKERINERAGEDLVTEVILR